MHGVAEISTTAIWPTGAGLRAGSGLFSDAKLRTAARLFNSTTSNDLNRQELNRLYGPPSYPSRY